jgi:secreted trypsin-like serine protease
MKVFLIKALPIIAAALALGACSTRNLNEQKPRTTELERVSDLFLNNDKIIGGERLSPVHLASSHIVALYNLADDSLCTGSIIAEDIILTAGHCIPQDPSSLLVLFGVDAQNYIEFRYVQFAGAHLKYQPREQGYWTDIGVVYFSGGLPDGYKPVQILEDDIFLQKGTQTELAGYGLADGVKKTGSGVLRHTTVKIEDPIFDFGEVELNQTQGKGACHGDSGGPAYIVENSQIKLWGITSRGEKDTTDDCSQFSVYTSATVYLGWINGSMKAIHDAADKQKQTNSEVAVNHPETAGNSSALVLASNLNLFR